MVMKGEANIGVQGSLPLHRSGSRSSAAASRLKDGHPNRIPARPNGCHPDMPTCGPRGAGGGRKPTSAGMLSAVGGKGTRCQPAATGRGGAAFQRFNVEESTRWQVIGTPSPCPVSLPAIDRRDHSQGLHRSPIHDTTPQPLPWGQPVPAPWPTTEHPRPRRAELPNPSICQCRINARETSGEGPLRGLGHDIFLFGQMPRRARPCFWGLVCRSSATKASGKRPIRSSPPWKHLCSFFPCFFHARRYGVLGRGLCCVSACRWGERRGGGANRLLEQG